MNAAETGATLDKLINSGKILSAGVSNFGPEDWRLLQANMKLSLVLNQIELGLHRLERHLRADFCFQIPLPHNGYNLY